MGLYLIISFLSRVNFTGKILIGFGSLIGQKALRRILSISLILANVTILSIVYPEFLYARGLSGSASVDAVLSIVTSTSICVFMQMITSKTLSILYSVVGLFRTWSRPKQNSAHMRIEGRDLQLNLFLGYLGVFLLLGIFFAVFEVAMFRIGFGQYLGDLACNKSGRFLDILIEKFSLQLGEGDAIVKSCLFTGKSESPVNQIAIYIATFVNIGHATVFSFFSIAVLGVGVSLVSGVGNSRAGSDSSGESEKNEGCLSSGEKRSE
jgi:hypothetical protein